MSTTSAPTSHAPTAADTPTRPSTARLAGIAALGFAAGVVVQNAILAGAPTPDMSFSEAARWYAENRTRAAAAGAIVGINLPLLLIFAATMRELGRANESARRWMHVGAFGAVGMVAVFGAVAAGKIASVLLAEAGDSSAFAAVWTLHNAAFAINLSVLGTAFLGFALGAHAAGLTHAWQRAVGVVGAVLLLAAGLAGTAVTDGSPVVFVGFGGFVLWLVWLVTTGTGLLRRPA
jgi:hypothetical protein